MQRRKLLIGALVAFLVLGALMFSLAIRGVGTLRRLEIDTEGFAGLPNGTYEGSYEYARWHYAVQVQIENGRAVDIEVISPSGDALAEQVAEAVLEAQTLDIDRVSGATASTNAVLKAIENALTGD